MVRGVAKQSFIDYVQRAVATEVDSQSADAGGQGPIQLLKIDCFNDLTHSKLVEWCPSFIGAEIVFLDLPKVVCFYSRHFYRFVEGTNTFHNSINTA